MEEQKMTIAYIGEHHPTTGTYYRQRLTVSPAEYNYINERITALYNKNVNHVKNSPLITSEQMRTLCFSKPLDISDRDGSKIYLTLSQLYLIWSFFPDNKRFTDNNTILLIKELKQ